MLSGWFTKGSTGSTTNGRTPITLKESMELSNFTKENTNLMSLDGKFYTAKIVYIYDGDTMHVVFKEFGEFYRWNCRISGVDTPELRTKNDAEKAMGYKVRDHLRKDLMNMVVKIRCGEFDKYGRLLIDVCMPEWTLDNPDEPKMLSEWLIEHKYAYAYGGGTKQSWDDFSGNST
jgi:endonuclease YncB( thermonuclease family)